MKLHDRIKHARQEKGLSQVEFAKALKVTQSTVQQWESGATAPKRARLPVVERVLGVSIDLNAGSSNTQSGPVIMGSAPLISWVQAGSWCDIADSYEPGDAEKWIPTTKRLGHHAFALRVSGDSMENPRGKPTYPDGSIIIVDPDKTVVNGSRVVVRLDDVEEATFKVYVEDAGKRYLKPLNPQYPTIEINSNATICGVVAQTIIEEP
ncbi:MAG TPA: XRE family transcriptional regulator [Gammaproteobacteria bacterium]|nr:XRE family transcriptional regulator [Gammaproteobacteria bacterium]